MSYCRNEFLQITDKDVNMRSFTWNRSRVLTGAAVLGASALVLTGCGTAPADGEAAASDSDFVPCAVSDVTGFDDRDFNQLSYEGVVAAAEQLGVETKTAESASEDQYAGNIQALIDQGCTYILTVGFSLANATRDAAQQSPDIDFALVDSAVSDADGNPLVLDNVKPVLFDTAQAAALAGYLAAGASETGIVGTYGGMPFPSVTVFMDGFQVGVEHYNEVHGTAVELLGWDRETQDGLFVGGFTDQIKAATLTDGLIDQGADVIMPVAGSLFEASAAAAQERGGKVALIGVNGDVYDRVPAFREQYLTSVLKNLTTATEAVTLEAGEGDFSNAPYVGTLENDGVGIAPLHDWESRLDPALIDEVEELRQQIISGDFVVESPSSPQG